MRLIGLDEPAAEVGLEDVRQEEDRRHQLDAGELRRRRQRIEEREKRTGLRAVIGEREDSGDAQGRVDFVDHGSERRAIERKASARRGRAERHYRLVSPDELSAAELARYRESRGIVEL